ncbi:hypothetical protein MMC24_005369 [Lignoscripta atroalba]|nr:hypothetical protein [Lignoscripta atroalba]
MDDDISPHSSRGIYDAECSWPSSTSANDSIAELSHLFDQQSLRSQAASPHLEAPALQLQDHCSSFQTALTSRPHNYPYHVRQQRQANTRRQCNLSHLARISALVQEVLQEKTPSYITPHPSSLDDTASLSPSQQGDLSFPNLPISSTSSRSSSSPPSIASISSSEDSEWGPSECPKRRYIYKVEKDPSPTMAADVLKRQAVVMKKIRMRKRTGAERWRNGVGDKMILERT